MVSFMTCKSYVTFYPINFAVKKQCYERISWNNCTNSKILKERRINDSDLLGCYSVSLGKHFPTCRRVVVLSYSGSCS